MAARPTEELKQVVAYADLCALFSAAFEFPSSRLAAALASGSFTADLCGCLEELGILPESIWPKKDMKGDLPSLAEGTDADTLLAELRREYSRLYLVPGKGALVYPYESAFRHVADGREGMPVLFISPVTIDVEKWMRRYDALPESAAKEPVDSISCELGFLRMLFISLANALHQGSQEDAAGWQQEIEAFRSAHIDTWGGAFMEQTIAHTRSPVYRNLARAARLVLAPPHPTEGNEHCGFPY
jgi:TorA maturation chaperone TorD